MHNSKLHGEALQTDDIWTILRPVSLLEYVTTYSVLDCEHPSDNKTALSMITSTGVTVYVIIYGWKSS